MIINRAVVVEDKTQWHEKYVLFPRRTLAGELVCFQQVFARWNNELNSWCEYGYSGTDGGWEYSLEKL